MCWTGPTPAALVAASLVFGGGRAAAAPGPVYGEFTLDGSSGGFSGTMTLARGFPAATFASNSIAPAVAPSGATAFLRAGTPFAAQYGASQGHGYLNLRPAANNAGAPSTTTYDFSSPTPASGCGFVLGDIDAASVAVSGTGPGFEPVAVADLGFAGTFNYCSASLAASRRSRCSRHRR